MCNCIYIFSDAQDTELIAIVSVLLLTVLENNTTFETKLHLLVLNPCIKIDLQF
jgi:hypothetical protein